MTRLRDLRTEVITGTDAANLQANIHTFTEAAGEATLISILDVDALTVIIVYTE